MLVVNANAMPKEVAQGDNRDHQGNQERTDQTESLGKMASGVCLETRLLWN